MNKIKTILTFLFIPAFVFSQDLSIASMPLDLIKGANAILRQETMEITIKSPAQAITRHSYAYTILNDKADDYASYSGYYNKFVTIEDIEGKLLDAGGKELKKVRKKDIADESSESGMSVSDTRYKSHSFYNKDYPYTAEYSSTEERNGIFYLAEWVPQMSPSIGVQKSKLIVKTPPGYVLRYKAYNLASEPVVTETPSGKTYEWSVEKLKAKSFEPMMPYWSQERIRVVLAPSEFEIDGYKGNMKTWKDFGAFMYQLTKNRDVLPPDVAQKAKELTAGMTDPYKKIEVLYQYMQNNTRYISIQLGIGGFQTIPAAVVAKNGYGDCKALSNYMASLLREVGINSRYVVIKSNNAGLFTDENFVSNQFDHMILCVPLVKDTVWLECTSQILPAGYLGDFTYNRPALLVDENGGVMVHTPSYRKKENLQIRKVNGVVDETGFLTATSNTTYSGLQQDDLHGLVKSGSQERILKMLRDRFDLPTYDIIKNEYTTLPGRIPELKEDLELTVQGYAQISGKRLFIVPNILSKSGVKFPTDTARVFDININYDYLDTDTVQIKVPEGYEVESLPKPAAINSKFGGYESSFEFKDNQILYTRSIQQNQGRFPAAEYNDLVEFYKSVYKADRVKVVLKKKE